MFRAQVGKRSEHRHGHRRRHRATATMINPMRHSDSRMALPVIASAGVYTGTPAGVATATEAVAHAAIA